jgi:hypothetical protein
MADAASTIITAATLIHGIRPAGADGWSAWAW